MLDVQLGSEHASTLNLITDLIGQGQQKKHTLSSVPIVDLEKLYSKCLNYYLNHYLTVQRNNRNTRTSCKICLSCNFNEELLEHFQ